MAGWTFDQLRASAGGSTLTKEDKDKLQIEITLVEHIVEAMDRLSSAVKTIGARTTTQ